MQNFFIFSLLFGCDVARRKGKKKAKWERKQQKKQGKRIVKKSKKLRAPKTNHTTYFCECQLKLVNLKKNWSKKIENSA